MMRDASRWLLTSVPPWLYLAAIIVILPPLVAAATFRGLLGIVALGALSVAGIVITLARPVPFLLLYVVLIPIESILVVGEAATVTRLVGIVFFAGYALRRFGHLELRAMPLAGWGFVAWAAVSALWALDPAVTVTQVLTVVQLFLMTVVVADLVAGRPELVRVIMWTYSVAAVATAAIAIGAFATGASFLAFGRAEAFESQDPAQFAAILMPAFFFMIFELRGRQRIGRVAFSLVVLAGAILLSGTRSAWLAVGIGFLLGVVPRLGTRAVVPALLLTLSAVAVIQIPEIGDYVGGRAGSALETGGAGRVDIWSVGLAIFADHPFIGVGYGNFPVAFTPEIIRDVNVPGLNPGILIPGLAPHSSVVGTLTELGLVGGFLLAIFLLTALLRDGWQADGGATRTILLALLTQSLFLDVFNRKQVWLMIAIALGYAWHATSLSLRARREDEDEHRRRVDRIRQTWVSEP